jgi:hypothetical protein
MTKNCKKITTVKKVIFFGSKTTIYLSLGLREGRPSYRDKNPSALKREHPTLQNMKFLNFVGHFWPPGSGTGFQVRIRTGPLTIEPDPIWIRIRISLSCWIPIRPWFLVVNTTLKKICCVGRCRVRPPKRAWWCTPLPRPLWLQARDWTARSRRPSRSTWKAPGPTP